MERREELQVFKTHDIHVWGPSWAWIPRWMSHMGPPYPGIFERFEKLRTRLKLETHANHNKIQIWIEHWANLILKFKFLQRVHD